jgi:hypothetical protein
MKAGDNRDINHMNEIKVKTGKNTMEVFSYPSMTIQWYRAGDTIWIANDTRAEPYFWVPLDEKATE